MYDSLIRVMLRLRPSDPDNYEDVYAVSSNNIDIQFFLPHREPEGFQFHRIFQPFSLQTDIYEQASLSQIDNFLRGQDSLVVAYGPKNSGKSYSLYGSLKIPNETNGLIPKAFIHIFKRMKDMRTRKEVSLVVSFMEIHANCIKDLGNSVSEDSNHMLEISNYDGPGHIDGLSVLLVESYQEVKTILETGLALRTQSKDGHLVLKLVMTAKENNEATNSYFYFVELAGIGNQRHDKVKYKELEFLNSSFISVKKAILGIQKGVHINHKESLLTWVLQKILNEKTNILLLAHINPHPANADEILETLDNAQQCIPLHNRPKSEQTGIVKITSQQVKRMQKIEDDIQEIKSLYDKSKEMHAERLQALAKLIGINDQLALYADSIIGSKEYLTAKNFKDAAVKSTELEQRNKAILDKIKQINLDVEESKKSEKESSKQSLNYAEKLRLKIHELKDSIVDTKDASKEVHELNVIERAEELQKLLLHSHILIEEKASVVHNLPYALKSKASDIRNLTDIKEMAKDAVVHDFINNFKLKEELQLEEIEKISQANKEILKKFEDQARRFELESSGYYRQKE